MQSLCSESKSARDMTPCAAHLGLFSSIISTVDQVAQDSPDMRVSLHLYINELRRCHVCFLRVFWRRVSLACGRLRLEKLLSPIAREGTTDSRDGKLIIFGKVERGHGSDDVVLEEEGLEESMRRVFGLGGATPS